MLAATYVSSSHFTVAGDHTALFSQYVSILCVQGTDGTLATYVDSSSYSSGSGLTTVVITDASLTANLTNTFVSYVSPASLPSVVPQLVDGKIPAGFIDSSSSGGGGSDVSFFRNVGTSPWEIWYSSGIPDSATTAGSDGNLAVVPFLSPCGGTLDKIGCRVDNGGDLSGHIRLGIYAATSPSNLYPHDLIIDAEEMAINDSGVFSQTINVTLETGVLYWLASLGDCGDAGTQFVSFKAGIGSSADGIIMGVLPALNYGIASASKSLAYGALPDPFPSGATLSDDSFGIPFVAVRYSDVSPTE